MSQQDLEVARGEAAKRAWEVHPEVEDFEERLDSYNDTMLTIMVARSLVDPNDATQPSDLLNGMGEEVIRARMTADGIRRVYDDLERATIASSPLRMGIADEDLMTLSARAIERLSTLEAPQANRIRRLLQFVHEEISG